MGPTQSIASARPSSSSTRCNLCDDVTCTVHRHASDNFEARLENPRMIFFAPKQAAKSQHVSHTVPFSSVLWCNLQIESRLVLRSKPRNRRGNFEAQITKLKLSVLRPKSKNRWHWFWGSIKKTTLLIFMCMIQTAHGITQLPDRPVTKYPTYAWSSRILCTKSPSLPQSSSLPAMSHLLSAHHEISKHDSPHETRIKVKLPKYPGFEFKPRHVNDSSQSNQGTHNLVSQSPPWWVHWQ
jgi:hypothetical protein